MQRQRVYWFQPFLRFWFIRMKDCTDEVDEVVSTLLEILVGTVATGIVSNLSSFNPS